MKEQEYIHDWWVSEHGGSNGSKSGVIVRQ